MKSTDIGSKYFCCHHLSLLLPRINNNAHHCGKLLRLWTTISRSESLAAVNQDSSRHQQRQLGSFSRETLPWRYAPRWPCYASCCPPGPQRELRSPPNTLAFRAATGFCRIRLVLATTGFSGDLLGIYWNRHVHPFWRMGNPEHHHYTLVLNICYIFVAQWIHLRRAHQQASRPNHRDRGIPWTSEGGRCFLMFNGKWDSWTGAGKMFFMVW